jgi:hypothetical protein
LAAEFFCKSARCFRSSQRSEIRPVIRKAHQDI